NSFNAPQPIGAKETIDFNAVCSSSASLTLTPPSSITAVDPLGATVGSFTSLPASIDPHFPFSSFMTCGSDPKNGLPGFYLTGEYPDYQNTGANTFTWNLGDFITGAIPDGIWEISYRNQDVAHFEMASLYPFDAKGHSRVYLPLLKVNVGA